MPALWRYTLREFVDAAEGARWRDRQALERLAWQTAYLLRAWVKNAPTAAELLGESTSTDAEAALEELAGAPQPSAVQQLDAAYAKQAALKAGTNGDR